MSQLIWPAIRLMYEFNYCKIFSFFMKMSRNIGILLEAANFCFNEFFFFSFDFFISLKTTITIVNS